MPLDNFQLKCNARILTQMTQNASPARLAFALQRLAACAVLAAGQHLALFARRTRPAEAALALAGRLAVAARLVAIRTADG